MLKQFNDFNSNMVQLKVVDNTESEEEIEFQFQYGTIKS